MMKLKIALKASVATGFRLATAQGNWIHQTIGTIQKHVKSHRLPPKDLWILEEFKIEDEIP